MASAKINPDLQSLVRPIDSLKPDKRNARKHGKRDLQVIAESLALHGQQKPIVGLKDGTIIAGNGTLEAARSLGWDGLAVVQYDSEDEAKARAFAIVDNRSAELSSWDFDVLASEMARLPEDLLRETGFNESEYTRLLGNIRSIDVAQHSREITDIKTGDTTCPKCGFEFDA